MVTLNCQGTPLAGLPLDTCYSRELLKTCNSDRQMLYKMTAIGRETATQCIGYRVEAAGYRVQHTEDAGFPSVTQVLKKAVVLLMFQDPFPSQLQLLELQVHPTEAPPQGFVSDSHFESFFLQLTPSDLFNLLTDGWIGRHCRVVRTLAGSACGYRTAQPT